MNETTKTDELTFLRERHKELATENTKMQEIIEDMVVTLGHAMVFISSRQKMHPDGIKLHEDLVTAGKAFLSDIKPKVKNISY